MYPEALNQPLKLPVEEIVNKLGLTIEYLSLPTGVFGEICFLNNPQRNIKEKTILIDKEKTFLTGIGNFNNTIIHECVHWFFHKGFFALQHLLDSSLKTIVCSQVDSDIHYASKYSEELRWMEWQANQLSPRILMPTKTVRIVYAKMCDKYSKTIETHKAKANMMILKEIAEIYGVSKQLAKIRLIQIGYLDFIGMDLQTESFSYVTKNNKILPGETYRISFLDFVTETYFNKELKQAIMAESLVFVDGFLVINDKKYVVRIGNSYLLTEEALNSVDECCIKFKTNHSTKTNMFKMYSMCFLCRNEKESNKNSISNRYIKSKENDEIIRKSYCCFKEDDEEENKMISNMDCPFPQAFKYLYDYYNMPSDSYCAKLCGLDHKTIGKYYNGDGNEPNYKTVLAICAGFCLRPRVAKKLLSTIGKDLSISPYQHDHLYDCLIHEQYESGLLEWNKCIKEAGFGEEYCLPGNGKTFFDK